MKTVLVVDDERQIAAIAGDYLRHAGFTVLTAGDGVEALALARSRHPDLVVPRPRPAATRRHRRRAIAPQGRQRADHHADGAGRRVRSTARAGARRGRLHQQAVQPARTGGARPGGPCAAPTPAPPPMRSFAAVT